MHGWRTASYTRTRCGSGAKTWTRAALNEAVTASELMAAATEHEAAEQPKPKPKPSAKPKPFFVPLR